MKYKLLLPKEDINKLKSKYVITNEWFSTYIELNDLNEYFNIQTILGKSIYLNVVDETIKLI